MSIDKVVKAISKMAKTERTRYCKIKATSLRDIFNVCNRHIRNIGATRNDLIACEDGSEADFWYCKMFEETWQDLRDDVSKMLEKQIAGEPDWSHPKLQAMLAREARWSIETRIIAEVLDAGTLEALEDVYDNDYGTALFERVKALKQEVLTTALEREVKLFEGVPNESTAFEDVLTCHLSGQLSAAQLVEHMKDPLFAAWYKKRTE